MYYKFINIFIYMSIETKETTYEIFKKLIKPLSTIDLSNEFSVSNKIFNYTVPNFSEYPKLKEFFDSEMNNIALGERKTYIIHGNKKPSYFFILTSEYLFYLSVSYNVIVYDNQLNYFFSHGFYTNAYSKSKLYKDNQRFFAEDQEMHFYYDNNDELYDKDTIRLRVNKNSFLEQHRNKVKDNKCSFFMNSTTPLTSIEYTNDTIISSFKSSLYSHIIMDYDFNILDMKFHKLVSKVNNFDTDINTKDIKDYNDLMKRFEDSLDMYKLVNDKSFKMKINEKKFNAHIDFIKKFTLNKKTITAETHDMLDSFLHFEEYRKTLVYKTIDLFGLLNIDFYSYFPKSTTDKFNDDPLDILLKGKNQSELNFLICQTFFLLLLHDDPNYPIINPDLLSNVLSLKNKSANIMSLMDN